MDESKTWANRVVTMEFAYQNGTTEKSVRTINSSRRRRTTSTQVQHMKLPGTTAIESLSPLVLQSKKQPNGLCPDCLRLSFVKIAHTCFTKLVASS